MRKITGNNGRTFSKSIAAGLVLLLVLAGWTPEAAGNSELDWSKVQAIKPGTPVTVLLHKDRGLRGKRKVRGHFHSATDDSVTLTLQDGQRHTFSKAAVRQIVGHHLAITVRLRKPKRDWSRVQTVKPGTHIKVVLYKYQAPRGNRKIKGYFHSATDDSLTLERKDGQRHTFQKSAVRKVLKRRPIWKRYQVWITLVITAAAFGRGGVSDPGPPSYIIPPTGFAFLVAPRWGGIYKVPPKYRTQPPADQPSGARSKTLAKQKNRQ